MERSPFSASAWTPLASKMVFFAACILARVSGSSRQVFFCSQLLGVCKMFSMIFSVISFVLQGSLCTNSSIYHYGGAFGDESKQTSMPTCMNRVHKNYTWKSKTVPDSSTCNRQSACFVESRHASYISKVMNEPSLGISNNASSSDVHLFCFCRWTTQELFCTQKVIRAILQLHLLR